MNDVELDLAHQRAASVVDATPSSRVFLSEYSSIAARSLNTDKNFAVLERERVSRPEFSEKLPMQKRHPPIGNKPHEDVAQLTQITSFPLSQLQATLHGSLCKCFKLTSIDADFSLEIPHADARGFC